MCSRLVRFAAKTVAERRILLQSREEARLHENTANAQAVLREVREALKSRMAHERLPKTGDLLKGSLGLPLHTVAARSLDTSKQHGISHQTQRPVLQGHLEVRRKP